MRLRRWFVVKVEADGFEWPLTRTGFWTKRGADWFWFDTRMSLRLSGRKDIAAMLDVRKRPK